MLLITNYQMNIEESGLEDAVVESSDEEGKTMEKTIINESHTNLMRGKSRGSLGRQASHDQHLSSEYASF